MIDDRGMKTVTYKGVTRTLREWAEIYGLNAVTLHYRHDAGWPPEELLEIRPRTRRGVRTVTYNGETRTIAEWAKVLNKQPTSIHARYATGRYTPAQILGLAPIEIAVAYVYTRSDGESGTMDEWAERLGKARTTLEARLRRGWEIDDAFELPEEAQTVETQTEEARELAEGAECPEQLPR